MSRLSILSFSLFFSLIGLNSIALSADEQSGPTRHCSTGNVYNVSKFKAHTQSTPVNLLTNGDFEQLKKGWRWTPGDQVVRGAGRNGSAGVIHRRKNPGTYLFIGQTPPVKPNTRYEFGVWAKAENIRGATDLGGTLCIEFYDKKTGSYSNGVYVHDGVRGNSDWKKLSSEFSVPEGVDVQLYLYIRRNMVGTVYFDDAYLKPIGGVWSVYMNHPACNTVSPDKPLASFNVTCNSSAPERKSLVLQLEFDNGFKIASRVKNGIAKFDFKKADFKGGQTLNCTAYLLDIARKTLLNKRQFPFQIRDTQAKNMGSVVRFNEHGVTIVNGKKFMPLGFFVGGITPRVVKHTKEAGGNVILSYGIFCNNPTRQRITEQMDMLQANDLMVIFSIKDMMYNKYNPYTLSRWNGFTEADDIVKSIVSEFRTHPALLAWFTIDENPVSYGKHLIPRRQQLNQIDPNHPVYGVTYFYTELADYGPMLDVLGIDPYRIAGNNTSMSKIRFAMSQARKTRLPVWVVPEAFNNNVYAPADKRGTFKTPTEQQMRSMALQMAGQGAKGFIFYKLDANWSKKLPKDHFKKFWPGMCGVFKIMRELEPYILSDIPIETVSVITKKGEVDAFLLTDSKGNQAVIVTSLRGEGQGTLRLKYPSRWKSRFGKTSLKNGHLVFKGQSIDSDVLFLEAP